MTAQTSYSVIVNEEIVHRTPILLEATLRAESLLPCTAAPYIVILGVTPCGDNARVSINLVHGVNEYERL